MDYPTASRAEAKSEASTSLYSQYDHNRTNSSTRRLASAGFFRHIGHTRARIGQARQSLSSGLCPAGSALDRIGGGAVRLRCCVRLQNCSRQKWRRLLAASPSGAGVGIATSQHNGLSRLRYLADRRAKSFPRHRSDRHAAVLKFDFPRRAICPNPPTCNVANRTGRTVLRTSGHVCRTSGI